ncbi:MAG: aminotransferase class V-fold PLP-dependent enzyme [Phycisphaerae bacterium]|nr:aminotransferase class V-fold PLP-dependent enzyme [Phycisphaerae bacterium]
MPSIEAIRARFPALRMTDAPMALLENAGGSQVPLEVADAIRAYMLQSYVQLGAGYAMSNVATRTVDAAHEVVNTLFNGTRVGKAILGASSTQLIHVVTGCIADRLHPGDEIVIAETGHEANIGPWLRLARAGAVIRWWKVDAGAQDCPIGALDALLTSRTKWVVFPHVSNLLGGIVDVQAITRKAHAAGARVFVDGVAFAPHRAMDVERWGVDWYVYSTYKVYGPHMGALFGTHEAIAELEGPNHFFIPKDVVPYKFELGGSSHEGCAAIVALAGYLGFLAGGSGTIEVGAGASPDACASLDMPAAGLTRAAVQAAFARMTELELPLQTALVEGVHANAALRWIGPAATGADERVPTVSFVHRTLSPSQVVQRAHAAGVAIRFGHMYAYRLCQALGIDTAEGVVRVSAVHYNTPDEVKRAVEAVVGP